MAADYFDENFEFMDFQYPEAIMSDNPHTEETRIENNEHLGDLTEALRDARDNGLIYWEPNTERGAVAKANMLAKIDRLLGRS